MNHQDVYLILKTLFDMICYILYEPSSRRIKDGFSENNEIPTQPSHLFKRNNIVSINYTIMQIIWQIFLSHILRR